MYKTFGTVDTNWAKLGAGTMLSREPNMNLRHRWEYEDGLMLNGMYEAYKWFHEDRYLQYIKDNIDVFVDGKGNIPNLPFEEYNLDNINECKAVLDLYDEFHDLRYKNAADHLYNQLLHQPRTKSGSFWHKNKYPYQVWLDGLYMASVFYARYQKEFGITDHLDDVVHQFVEAYKVTVDKKTGLFYHAYDETHKQFWANPENGQSPHFWLRSMGWYVMALVDVREYLPDGLNGKDELLDILNNLLDALENVADDTTNLWYQIPDEGGRPLNYLEASGSLMILNAIAKGIRKGYLSENKWGDILDKGWKNAITQFLTITNNGWVNVNRICHVGSLTAPYKDGSYAYYVSEPIVSNDHKGVGPFLMLAVEMERRKKQADKKAEN